MDKLGQGAGFGHVGQSSQPWQALALVCSVKVVRDVVATPCTEPTVTGAGAGSRAGGRGQGNCGEHLWIEYDEGGGGRLLPRSMSRALLRFGGLNPVDRAL